MLRVNGISPGQDGVSYLLGKDGCAQHEVTSPERYYMAGAEVGPVGRWHGAGLEHLGFSDGQVVSEADARAVLGHLADPRVLAAEQTLATRRIAARLAAEPGADAARRKEIEAEEMEVAIKAARLGREPMKFKSLDERVAAALAREGLDVGDGANAERIEEIREAERATTRQAVGFFDATFSPVKSISLYHAGLLAAGRYEDAAKVTAAHEAGVAAALAYWQEHAGYSRAGYHSTPAPGKPSVGRYVDGHEWIAAAFEHQTNREGEPQLHTHLAILNKVRTVDEDGSVHWRTLDSRAMSKLKTAAAAVYERTMEQAIEADLPVAFAMRPDGVARELVGISAAEREAFSSRRVQVEGKLAEYVAAYKEHHGGAEPSPYLLTLMSEDAALRTRKGKENAESAGVLLERWEAMAGERIKGSLAAIPERAEAAALDALRAAGGGVIDREAVIRHAIAITQTKQATWTRSDLVAQLNRALPDRLPEGTAVPALLEDLADQALSGRYGTVQVEGFELIAAPAALRRASDGRSIYRPGSDERYATMAHLSAEERLVDRVRSRGGIALDPRVIEETIARAGVSDDQAGVVRGVLGDGARASVVVGPAGTGKSYVQGIIASAWGEHVGGRVIGLGPSSVAAEVLAEEGLEHTVNTTRFLMYAGGMGPAEQVERFALTRGDLVIVDEAGMTSTEHITRISELAEAAGAKLVLVGDDAQLAAVDAGGAFRLARQAGTAYELESVRRFRDADGSVREWEATASLGLREGDAGALAAYERHGRIMGGTEAECDAAAVRAYVADVLEGRDAALVAGTVARAAALSGAIRDELVGFGLVEAEGVTLADATVAGVGDVIQTRKNDAGMLDSDGKLVLNRRTYRVQARGQDGSLSVRRIAGRGQDGAEILAGQVALPASYVAEHVQLGYAGTVHAVQGRTVARGYLVADEMTSRELAYVGLTRGTEVNRAFVTSTRPADEHQVQALHSDPRSVLAGALERDTAEKAAATVLAEALSDAEKLPALAPIWADVVERHGRTQTREALAASLPAEVGERLEREDPGTIARLLRSAEIAGHDRAAVLAETTKGSFSGARNAAAVLAARIQDRLQAREPEQAPARTWAERTPVIEGELGIYAAAYAQAMDARERTLGEQAAAQPPAWASARLGPVPTDVLERADWERRAGAVASYRELYHLDEAATTIGPAPAAGASEQRADWERAYAALGADEDALRLAATSEGALLESVGRWEREKAWAPAHVGPQLAKAQASRLYWDEDATLARARGNTEQAQRSGLIASWLGGYAADLDEIQGARDAWHTATTEAREQGQAAAGELARRSAETQAPVVEVEQVAKAEPTPEAEPLDMRAELERARAARERIAARRLEDEHRREQAYLARERESAATAERSRPRPGPSLELGSADHQ